MQGNAGQREAASCTPPRRQRVFEMRCHKSAHFANIAPPHPFLLLLRSVLLPCRQPTNYSTPGACLGARVGRRRNNALPVRRVPCARSDHWYYPAASRLRGVLRLSFPRSPRRAALGFERECVLRAGRRRRRLGWFLHVRGAFLILAMLYMMVDTRWSWKWNTRVCYKTLEYQHFTGNVFHRVRLCTGSDQFCVDRSIARSIPTRNDFSLLSCSTFGLHSIIDNSRSVPAICPLSSCSPNTESRP